MIPDTITTQWIANLLIAFIIGIVTGKLLKTILWLAILIGIVFIVVQFIWITPAINLEDFVSPEKLEELGKSIQEIINNIIPHFKEHLKANSIVLISFGIGFILSFFIGKD